MPFNNEPEFEQKFVELLTNSCGWEKNVIKYPTEEDLIENWATILFNNNNETDKLNGVPLTDSEINQVINQINQLKTPVALNNFINGKSVTIERDNPKDELHFGKNVSLKIYDREEIAGGSSRYQVVEQPKFKTDNSVYPERRADVMLLINGMPVIHIELKKTGVPISQAEVQIEKYMENGCFTGIFSLVQIFVAMNPEESVYFANPGPNGKFNPNFYFHWEDFNNDVVNEWSRFTQTVLSIPRAHEMIGYYTVPDDTDGVLKVLRSYQFFAVDNIAKKVDRAQWTRSEQRGGYIWHTTGSGKTMTSFKAAQLIASSKSADKVIFLIDRIELGDQSLIDYRNYANPDESVQATEDTNVLFSKLLDDSVDNTLIITSIQKMSRITEDSNFNSSKLNKIKAKRIVFIIDECHRDQKGEMHLAIKHTFPNAMFFGFTGTPDGDYTSDIFGDELHRYTIAHGIRDKNVLGFDPVKCSPYNDKDLKLRVVLDKVKCKDVNEVYSKGQTVISAFNDLMNSMSMVEVEKNVDVSSFHEKKYISAVVSDILSNWMRRSYGSLFHAIFATSSIKEAIDYYYEFKAQNANIKVTAVFDPSDDNSGLAIYKMHGITDILTDYKDMFGNDYNISSYQRFKKDVCLRLAHKKPYINLKPADKIDLVIVVDQLLTGFDSKWINTLYMDKTLEGKNLIQAISRTNRLYGKEKPHGTICFYRYTNTMEQKLNEAMDIYSGKQKIKVFVNKLGANLDAMNFKFNEIKKHFEDVNITDFMKNDDDLTWKKKFAKLFVEFNEYLDPARIQGFIWEKLHYEPDETSSDHPIDVLIDKNTYLVLAKRYQELFTTNRRTGGTGIPIDIDTSLMEIHTDMIDDEYINKKFKLFVKDLNNGDPASKEKLLKDLHSSFSTLSQEEQKFASLILNDVEKGDFKADPNKTFRDYLTEYKVKAYNDNVRTFSRNLGLDEVKLRKLLDRHVDENSINDFGYYDDLLSSLKIETTQKYYKDKYDKDYTKMEAKLKADQDIRRFILSGGYES